ncbi:TonB-dependent receptor plug domain-containing protein [Termitidicoccus mucosus]
MSPFEVQTERDQGFVAASMLTGGRLATDLKDTPIAYTVLTREFIDAMQLADLSEMHEWSTNTQSTKRDGTQYGTGETVSIRSRGIGTSIQKNFFPVNYNFDGYNLERLDLARGPNAVLFGSNSLGGAVNSITKRALIGKRKLDVRAAYGSWGNLRTTLDYNQPVGKNLSFRANALWQERDGWRTTDYSETKGLTLAGTLKLSKGTEIRMEVEQGKMKRSITANFMDQLSGWDGVSSVDTYNVLPGDRTLTGINKITNTGRGRLIYTPALDGRLINYANWGQTFGAGAYTGSLVAGVPFAGMNPNISGRNIREQQNLPADLYDNAINNSYFRIPRREFSSFTNEPIYGVDNDSYTVSLTQQIGRNFFMELALNRQSERVTTDMGISRGMANVYIDVNKKTPEGDDNPNYLQPYAQHDSNPSIKDRDRVNARVALGYVLDAGAVGNFTFSLMGGVSNAREVSELYWYALRAGDDPTKWTDYNGSTAIAFRYYFYTDQPRTRPMPDTWRYVDPVAGTTADTPAGQVRDFTNSAQNQISEIDYTYIQVATNAKLLNNRLSLVLAARHDRYKTRQEALDWLGNFPLDWNGTDWQAKPAAPASYGSLTYRLRDADGIPYGPELPADVRPRDPQGARAADMRYADDHFQDDYSPPGQKGGVTTVSVGTVWHATRHISPFVNFAQSFVPPQGDFRLNGSLAKHVSSQGWDAGLRFTLLGGRAVATASYYQGLEKNARASTTGFGAELPRILKARPLEGGYQYNKYLPLLPTGFSDFANRETEGFEFELTANLAKNWRLLFNAALPRTWDTNGHKDSFAYYNANKATLIQIIRDAGGVFDAAEKFASTGPGMDTDGQTAVTAWNTIQNTIDAYSARMPTTRVSEVTANLFTDYAFSRGFLKGVTIGGGFNYRGKQPIGFKGADTIAEPDNPGAAIDDPSVGKDDAVYLDGYYLATLAISYKRRIFKNKAELVISLNVNNALDYDKPVYYDTIMRPPGGDVSTPARVATPNNYYWETPRNFLLTARLLF